MSKEVKSARGALVNFDLLKIKQQMATATKPTVVQARENFVDAKLKRRVRRLQTTANATIIDASDNPQVDPKAKAEANSSGTPEPTPEE